MDGTERAPTRPGMSAHDARESRASPGGLSFRVAETPRSGKTSPALNVSEFILPERLVSGERVSA